MNQRELYILCPRTMPIINMFFKLFLPNWEKLAEEYEVPQYADNPEIVFENPDEIISYLIKNHEYDYSMYFQNKKNEEPEQGMLFFTNDGYLIIGIVVRSDYINWFKKLKNTFDASFGYLTLEEVPPNSSFDFKRISESTITHRLVNGSIIKGVIG